jgi:hypothetical protein
MRIRSQLGRGTIVWLRLPADADDADAVEAAAAGNAEAPRAPRRLGSANLVQKLDQLPIERLRAAG